MHRYTKKETPTLECFQSSECNKAIDAMDIGYSILRTEHTERDLPFIEDALNYLTA